MTKSNSSVILDTWINYEHPWYSQLKLLDNTMTCESPLQPKLKSVVTGQKCTKECSKCLEIKPLDFFRIEQGRNWRLAPDQQRSYYREECKQCERRLSKQLREAKKSAPPKPQNCQCCSKLTDNLVVDHDHNTGQFRGWLCRRCNLGIGKLGDTVESLQNALNYLSNGNQI